MSGRKSTKTRKVGQNKSREGRSNSVDRSKGKNSEESVKRKLSKGKATKV